MSSDMTPQAALDAAVTTRKAATIHQMPGWFPAVAAMTFMVAMVLMGSSWLTGSSGGTGRIIGLSGSALLVIHIALMPVLVVRWRRSGVVPRAGQCAPAERRRSLWMMAAGLAICAALWAATGQVGWAVIAFAVLGGAEAWYRLKGLRSNDQGARAR